MENQTDLDQDLRALLDLLMSENREKTVKDEKARLREYLKAIGILIKQQKDIQGRTAGGDDHKQLAGEQGKVADKTGRPGEEHPKERGKGRGRKGRKREGRQGQGRKRQGEGGQGRERQE